MLNTADKPEINEEECTGCAECVPACPSDALSVQDNKVTISTEIDCSYCGDCQEACPTGAITCPYEIVVLEESA